MMMTTEAELRNDIDELNEEIDALEERVTSLSGKHDGQMMNRAQAQAKVGLWFSEQAPEKHELLGVRGEYVIGAEYEPLPHHFGKVELRAFIDEIFDGDDNVR